MIDKNAKEILSEMKDLEELLKEDLESWNPRTLPGKMAQHAQARARLKELTVAYKKFVSNNVAAIFVDGDADSVANFTKLAQEKGGTITVDARGIYLALVDEIYGSLRSYRGTPQVDFSHVSNLNAKLELVAAQLGYPGDLNARFTKLLDRPFTSKSDLVNAIRPLMIEGCGDVIYWTYIMKEIEDRAFASGTSNSPVPCVILNAGEDDEANLLAFVFGQRFVNVKVEGEITAYTVTKAFNELKKKLKSLTNPTDNTTTEE